MPIFDQGYQHWDGKLSGHAWRWLAVARRGVRTQLKNRWTRMVLLLAWLPAIALGGFLALWGLLEQRTADWAWLFQALPAPILKDPKAFRPEIWTLVFSRFLAAETTAAMILILIVGPNLISQDMRFNAMPLYLSRPLTRFDYFAGKLATIATFLAAVMIVPAILTYVLGVAFSLSFSVVSDTYRILPACLAYGAIVVVAAGLFMLAISSLTKNSRYVAAIWVGLWLVGGFASNVLGDLMNLEWGPIVSLTNDLSRIRGALLGDAQAFEKLLDTAQEAAAPRPSFFGRFRQPAPPPRPPNPLEWNYPWQWSAYVLLGLVGISLWILTTRVKSLDRLR